MQIVDLHALGLLLDLIRKGGNLTITIIGHAV